MRSSCFAKPGANQGLDPPALFTAMDTPQAFGVVGDLSADCAKETPLLFVLHFSYLQPLILGCRTPCFSAVFRPVCGFQRRGGILTLPQRRKGHTGATVGFTVLLVWVVSATQVYFQLQTEKSIVLQRFFGFHYSTAEEAEQYHCYTSVTAV